MDGQTIRQTVEQKISYQADSQPDRRHPKRSHSGPNEQPDRRANMGRDRRMVIPVGRTKSPKNLALIKNRYSLRDTFRMFSDREGIYPYIFSIGGGVYLTRVLLLLSYLYSALITYAKGIPLLTRFDYIQYVLN